MYDNSTYHNNESSTGVGCITHIKTLGLQFGASSSCDGHDTVRLQPQCFYYLTNWNILNQLNQMNGHQCCTKNSSISLTAQTDWFLLALCGDNPLWMIEMNRNDPKTVEIIKVRLPVHQVQHAGGSCDYVMTMGSICLKGTIQCFAFDLLIHFGVLLFRIWFFSKVKTSAFDKRHLMAPVLSDSRVISRDCFPQTLNKVGMEFVVAAMIRMCLFLESPFKKQIEKQTRQRESKL